MDDPDRNREGDLDTYKELSADLKAIFDISYDVIYVSDANGITLRVSSACEKLWGRKESELVGRSVFELEREGVFKPSITRLVLEKQEKVSAIQTTKAGRQLMVVGTPIRNGQGKIIRVVNASRDITEISQLKSELEEIKQLIEGYKTELMNLRKINDADKRIVCRSVNMKKGVTLAQKVAEVDSTVLITGESGVGKNTIASHIHKWSRRKHAPFIIVNCGSIPENLLEYELFGTGVGSGATDRKESPNHVLRKARGGTLFLDEVTEMPLPMQLRLLGLLQGSYNVRIIASSTKNMDVEVNAGRFREDLYYRLNVIPIHIPPLRHRKEDILPLVLYFADQFQTRYKLNKQFSANTVDKLKKYPWPGNVRELMNVIERLIVTVESPVIMGDQLPESILKGAAEEKDVQVHRVVPLKDASEMMEKALLEMAREKYGSTTRIAEALGVNQSTISRKLQYYGIR